jgi:hypothetical protein
MHAAEAEWREALAARTLAGVRQSAERRLPHLGGEARRWYADRRG